jgi:hypothetical protein
MNLMRCVKANLLHADAVKDHRPPLQATMLHHHRNSVPRWWNSKNPGTQEC